jgi:alpha-ribazole phosphatase
MRIYLLRHTPVAVPAGICYGRSDVDLAASWREDWAQLRAKLPAPALCAEVVYSSPLRRCLQLARLASERVICDARLVELDFGRWEGLAWEAIPAEELRAWSGNYYHSAAGGGESYGQLFARTGTFFTELVKNGPATALIITHGGVIRALLARLLELSPRQALTLQIDYGSVSAVQIERDWLRIEYINR